MLFKKYILKNKLKDRQTIIKMSKRNSKQTKVEDQIVEDEILEEEVNEEKPKKKTKKDNKPKDVKKQIENTEVSNSNTEVVNTEVVNTEVVDDVQIDQIVKKRVAPNRESILLNIDEMISSVENEIAILRESKTKTKGIKFLRSLNKKLKTLKTHSSRVIKQRNTSGKKSGNFNSGFLKPVQISTEMAKFTGWNVSVPKSRVDVTKYICNYIKENELQNPKDKRQILADSKLSKLLNYDPKKTIEPLTYYRIQSYIKPHFIKSEPVH